MSFIADCVLIDITCARVNIKLKRYGDMPFNLKGSGWTEPIVSSMI